MKKRINISIDSEVHDILKEMADEDYKSVSQLITDLVLSESRIRRRRTTKINYNTEKRNDNEYDRI